MKPTISQYNLVGYWPLNESSGTAYDYSGSGNNGTVTGTSSVKTTYNGRYARSFNGTSDIIVIGDLGTSIVSEFTINIWAYYDTWVTDTSKARGLFDTREDITGVEGNDGLRLENYNGTLNWVSGTHGTLNSINTGLISSDVTGKWSMLTFIYRDVDKYYEFWYNGIMKLSGTLTYNIPSDGFENFVLGAGFDRDNSTNRYFDGLISEVSVFNTNLSQEEIKEIYNQTYRT